MQTFQYTFLGLTFPRDVLRSATFDPAARTHRLGEMGTATTRSRTHSGSRSAFSTSLRKYPEITHCLGITAIVVKFGPSPDWSVCLAASFFYLSDMNFFSLIHTIFIDCFTSVTCYAINICAKS